MILRFIIILSLFQFSLFGQSENETINIVKEEVEHFLISHYDSTYRVTDIVSFDFTSEDLADCYWFTAKSSWKYETNKTNFVTGIYRYNEIIWQSDLIASSAIDIQTGIADDLDGNGKIELSIVLIEGNWENSIEYWWIYEWNGSSGEVINEINEFTDESIISMVGQSGEIIDIDLDGKYEIIGINPIDNDGKYLTYSIKNNIWNNWNGALNVNNVYFKPANLLESKINCYMQKMNNSTYSYNYKILNDDLSKQNIFKIYLKTLDKNVEGVAPLKWYFSKVYVDTTLVMFEENIFPFGTTSQDIISNQVNYLTPKGISPSDSVTNFLLNSAWPPRISRFFIQSKTEIVQVIEDSLFWAEKEKENIYNNSFLCFSLSPFKITYQIALLDFVDSLINYNNQSYDLSWINDEPTYNKYNTYLQNAKTALEQNDTNSARIYLQNIITDVDIDSTANLTSEAYALLKFNTEYLLEQLPESVEYPYLKVNFKDSQGNLLPESSLQYYESGWKEAISNDDGTYRVETEKSTVSLRIKHAGASQTVPNIGTQNNTFTFSTVSSKVQLKDSQGNLLEGGTVQYYASGWKEFGVAENGEVTKELLPKEYSFRMSYGGTSLDKKQNIGTDQTVVFQTVNANVQLKDSQDHLLDGGTVQYYASGWKEFGVAENGEVTKELLPKEYSFRMSYGGTSLDKKQNIGTDQTVVFQTVNANVQLKDSQDNLLDGGIVQYYASGWKEFGVAENGEVTKELLPKEYSFRMSYGGTSLDKKQNIGTDQTVVFQTVNANVQLKDSQDNLLDGGTVQYYAAGWKEFGVAENSEVTKELLPKEYSFRMSYGGASLDKKQNIGVDGTVVFQTVNSKVQLQDSQGNLLDGGIVQYYASGWKEFGVAENGEVTKELLPKEYSFRMSYGGTSLDKKQNIATDQTVVFQTVNTNVQLKDSQGNLLAGGTVQYYASGWKEFDAAENGEVTRELLPKEYSFRMSYGGASLDKKQNIGTEPLVEFQTVKCIIKVIDEATQPIDDALVSYYASGWKQIGNTINGEITKELLPKNYSFRVSSDSINKDLKQDIGINNIVEFTFN